MEMSPHYDPTERIRQLLQPREAAEAVYSLLLAYAKGVAYGGEMDWEDVDEAFGWARDALPGEYERILNQLCEQEDED